ncbi:hypothetical protein OMAG_000956 [Candidatus Omnitrophus magneticus]|uniref:Uncharacterized protein n=1 Tax=Candidatus Omnitrophus magneticus TaxID=1609969 RepID=A0A0F0CRR9_9BACT|nr:hypothetical protein OMAG_002557 [Candidatus Omnitrophus magneticus]KJJ84184.1 hypothetical protein OMAG_001951 [Candidatus Omnitrophus magneticus]KJJ84186.1 hypothetical protein OMAG_001947 [Candidatus Omnitrophus magneticus]KJJ85178.1 hypothetical protein OMAG_000956 [Candidatus Omnitrophus magneticus]
MLSTAYFLKKLLVFSVSSKNISPCFSFISLAISITYSPTYPSSGKLSSFPHKFLYLISSDFPSILICLPQSLR